MKASEDCGEQLTMRTMSLGLRIAREISYMSLVPGASEVSAIKNMSVTTSIAF